MSEHSIWLSLLKIIIKTFCNKELFFLNGYFEAIDIYTLPFTIRCYILRLSSEERDERVRKITMRILISVCSVYVLWM